MPKKTTANEMKTTERTRWGGALLAVGALLAIASLSLFLTRPAVMDPSQAARIAGLAANPGVIQLEGYVGVFGYLTLAVAAFFLVARDAASKAGVPASAFWIPVGAGAMVLVGVEAVLATSLSPLAAGAATAPLLLQTVASIIALLAGIGTLGIGAGAIFIFWGETRTDTPAIPTVVAYIGIVGALATILGAFGFITGLRQMLIAFYATYLVYVPFLVMGVKLAFPGLRLSSANPDVAQA